MECAVETVRWRWRNGELFVGSERPEFWERLWALDEQSEVGGRRSKAQRDSCYCECGEDNKELVEWVDNNDPKLAEIESIKL